MDWQLCLLAEVREQGDSMPILAALLLSAVCRRFHAALGCEAIHELQLRLRTAYIGTVLLRLIHFAERASVLSCDLSLNDHRLEWLPAMRRWYMEAESGEAFFYTFRSRVDSQVQRLLELYSGNELQLHGHCRLSGALTPPQLAFLTDGLLPLFAFEFSSPPSEVVQDPNQKNLSLSLALASSLWPVHARSCQFANKR